MRKKALLLFGAATLALPSALRAQPTPGTEEGVIKVSGLNGVTTSNSNLKIDNSDGDAIKPLATGASLNLKGTGGGVQIEGVKIDAADSSAIKPVATAKPLILKAQKDSLLPNFGAVMQLHPFDPDIPTRFPGEDGLIKIGDNFLDDIPEFGHVNVHLFGGLKLFNDTFEMQSAGGAVPTQRFFRRGSVGNERLTVGDPLAILQAQTMDYFLRPATDFTATAASINFVVDGLIEADHETDIRDTPGRIEFHTSPNDNESGAQLQLRMVIKNDGKVGVDTEAPRDLFDAAGQLLVGRIDDAILKGFVQIGQGSLHGISNRTDMTVLGRMDVVNNIFQIQAAGSQARAPVAGQYALASFYREGTTQQAVLPNAALVGQILAQTVDYFDRDSRPPNPITGALTGC